MSSRTSAAPPVRAGTGVGRAGQREPAGAAHARPLRQPYRRGRLPSRLAPAARPRAVSAGLTDAWNRPDGHLRRAAGFMVWAQAEAGHGCPVSMTHAAVPALRTDPALAAEWEPRLTSHVYEQGLRPADRKAGVLFGMGMTEKQGGSDVRANTTSARAAGRGGRVPAHRTQVVLLGADVATGSWCWRRPPGGLTCFLVPRVLPDGTRNVFAHPAAQGQAGQPLQRLERGRVRRDLGAPGRRGGPRGAHHHRDGRGDPAGLRARVGRADAPGGGAGGPPRARTARRSAAS